MQRYFLEEVFDNQETLNISGEIFHHMKRVMRMKAGQECIVVFANEVTQRVKIQEFLDDAVVVKLLEKIETKVELPVNFTIACGFPKGDKAELITQKCAELGAESVQFFPSEFSVVKWDDKKLSKKEERLQKIAKEACEQSHRTHLATVNLFGTQKEFLNTFDQYDLVLIAYEESAKEGETKNLLKSFEQLNAGEKCLVLFGSEGGFSTKEVENFQDLKGIPCGLGPRIMRAETAPFYLLSAASFYFEMM